MLTKGRKKGEKKEGKGGKKLKQNKKTRGSICQDKPKLMQ